MLNSVKLIFFETPCTIGDGGSSTLFTTYTVCTVWNSLHCLNIRLERCWMQALWASEKNVGVDGWYPLRLWWLGYTTRAPAVLKTSFLPIIRKQTWSILCKNQVIPQYQTIQLELNRKRKMHICIIQVLAHVVHAHAWLQQTANMRPGNPGIEYPWSRWALMMSAGSVVGQE